MPAERSHPNETGQVPQGRARRILSAIVAVLLARYLVPGLFPYLNPDPYLQQLLERLSAGSFAIAACVVGTAYLLPCFLLGVWVYSATAQSCARASSRRAAQWSGVAAAAAIAGMVWLAYTNRFVADDAYISFRYARHLIEGAGLVYNLGERVEGYTNFLWVMLVAAGLRFGADPVVWAQGLGLLCFAGTLAATYRLARLVLPGARWALAAILLVGTQFSVLSFATGGLETSLQTFLVTLGHVLVFSAHGQCRWRTRDLSGLSLVLAAGVLTRMDFAVFGGVLLAAAGVSVAVTGMADHRARRGALVRKIGLLVLPAALIVGVWLLWKWRYYGTVLPNTYYAKRPGPGGTDAGFAYLWSFCKTYRYLLPLVAFMIGAVELVRGRHLLLTGVASVMAWCGYVAVMGGGFIEFRFLAPIMPLFMVCVLWIATRFAWSRRMHLAVVLSVWIAYGSLHHVRTFGWVQNRAEPVAHLKWQTEDALWTEAGRELHRFFGHDDVVIATTVAGILPYHARLTTIDMHGLTDPAVARGGRMVSNRPGHKRFATAAYLKQRGVNLVIGHPKTEPSNTLHDLPPERLTSCIQAADVSGEPAIVLAIPITKRHALLVWYLKPHPAIDRAIETHGWPTFMVPPVTETHTQSAASRWEPQRDRCGAPIRTPDAKSGATDAACAPAPHLAWGVLNRPPMLAKLVADRVGTARKRELKH